MGDELRVEDRLARDGLFHNFVSKVVSGISGPDDIHVRLVYRW
jgi:hypothetical protein